MLADNPSDYQLSNGSAQGAAAIDDACHS
jgi:hypothetical protein